MHNVVHMEHIGNTVTDFRVALGLTVGQLASRVGISEAYLGLIEAGQRTPTAPLWSDIRAAIVTGIREKSRSAR